MEQVHPREDFAQDGSPLRSALCRVRTPEAQRPEVAALIRRLAVQLRDTRRRHLHFRNLHLKRTKRRAYLSRVVVHLKRFFFPFLPVQAWQALVTRPYFPGLYSWFN